MRHPFTFFKPYLIIIFNVYPQIAEKRRTKSTMFANVAFCLIFQFTWYLSESAGFETEIHSRADFQLAHFTAGLDGTAFRHACLPACLLARLLASTDGIPLECDSDFRGNIETTTFYDRKHALLFDNLNSKRLHNLWPNAVFSKLIQ